MTGPAVARHRQCATAGQLTVVYTRTRPQAVCHERRLPGRFFAASDCPNCAPIRGNGKRAAMAAPAAESLTTRADRLFGGRLYSGRRCALLDEPFLLEFAPEILRDRRLHRIPVLFYLPFARSTHYDGNRLGRGRRELQSRGTQIDAVTLRDSS